MTCTVLLEARFKAEEADGVGQMFKSLFPDTRAFPGCIDIYISRSQDDPQTFVIVETWETREHYEKYLAWRTETGTMEMLGGKLAGAPSIRFFDRIGA